MTNLANGEIPVSCVYLYMYFILFSHQDSGTGSTLSNVGYICPQCQSKYCELPIECQTCGKSLISSANS